MSKKYIDPFDLQEMAGLVCGLTSEQTDAIIDDDEDFDSPLLDKLGVDFEQFSNVAEAILNSGHLTLGLSPLTGTVYLGLQRGHLSVGHRIDVTSDILSILELKFPVNTAQVIEVNGQPKSRFLNLSMDKEVLINGKNPFEKSEE